MLLLLAIACNPASSYLSSAEADAGAAALPEGERMAVDGSDQYKVGTRVHGAVAPLPWGYDVDGDGMDDPLTMYCDPTDTECEFEPRAYMQLGKASGEPVLWTGDSGVSGMAAGDFNGDGFDDIATSHDALGVLLNLGSVDGPMDAMLALEVEARVFPAGDVNGDGYDDIAVVASDIQVYAGGPEGLDGTVLNTLYGRTTAPAGDVNGDGFGDLLVNDGSSFLLYPGGESGVGEAIFGWYGKGLPVGDVDGDGLDDVAAVELERISLFLAIPTLPIDATPTVSLTWTDAGRLRPSGVGDVNGDGFADLLVGTPDVNEGIGAAELYLGSETGWDVNPALTLAPSSTTPSFLGSRVGGLGDVDGDGISDFGVANKCRGSQPCMLQVAYGGPDAAAPQ